MGLELMVSVCKDSDYPVSPKSFLAKNGFSPKFFCRKIGFPRNFRLLFGRCVRKYDSLLASWGQTCWLPSTLLGVKGLGEEGFEHGAVSSRFLF